MRNDTAIFILSHGRADKQDTLSTLQSLKCEIPIYIVVDDMDDDLEAYKAKYNNVLVFDKKAMREKIDTMNNGDIWSSCLYARNFISEYASENGFDYYIMMDDDITDLKIRAVKDNKLKALKIKSIDNIFYAMCDYMSECDKLELIGFAQSGAYIGGENGAYKDKVKRFVSQVFIGKSEYKTKFRGVMCQDFLGSMDCALNGRIAITTFLVSISSPKRMSNKGGMYNAYQNTDVYGRDFYICMAYPSIGFFTDTFEFQKQTNLAFPKILNENCKKQR